VFDTGHRLSIEEQEYNLTWFINEIRRYVEDWANCATLANKENHPPLGMSR
jgi:hypothetical protein